MNYRIKKLLDKHLVTHNSGEKQREELVREKEFIEETLERFGEYYDNINRDVHLIRLICQGEAGSQRRIKAFKHLFDFSGEIRVALDKFIRIIVTKYWDKNWDCLTTIDLSKEEKKVYCALTLNKENNPYSPEKCTTLLQRYVDVDARIKELDTINNLPSVVERFDTLVKEFEEYKRKTDEAIRSIDYKQQSCNHEDHRDSLFVRLGRGEHCTLGGGYEYTTKEEEYRRSMDAHDRRIYEDEIRRGVRKPRY